MKRKKNPFILVSLIEISKCLLYDFHQVLFNMYYNLYILVNEESNHVSSFKYKSPVVLLEMLQ